MPVDGAAGDAIEVPKAASTTPVSPAFPEASFAELPEHPHATLGTVAVWGAGLLVLAGLVTFILHFGD